MKALHEMSSVEKNNMGISDEDARRFANLSLKQFNDFRMGNYCPACGWQRTHATAGHITPFCPACGENWDHTSSAAGTGGPDSFVDDKF